MITIVKSAGAEIMLGLRDDPVIIPKGNAIAEMELLFDSSAMTVVFTQEKATKGKQHVLWKMAIQAGDRLSQHWKEQLFIPLLE